LLLPVHIVLLELLIDPACSVVFEAEPAETGIMRRPPRPPRASPFAIGNVSFALAQGLGVAILLLSGYALLHGLGWTDDVLRASVFIALVLGLFLLILANRDLGRAVWRNWRVDNPWLPRMFAGVALILAAVLTIPPIRAIMGFGEIDRMVAIASSGLLLACWAWLELLQSTRMDRRR
jgi:Ca2+-transporting ATPase